MQGTPDGEPRSSPRQRLLAAARLLATIGILIGLVYRLSPGEIADAAGGARLWPLVAAGALMVPVQALVVVKWRWLVRGRGVAASDRLLTESYFQANLVTTVLPTSIGGDVYRVYRVARETGGAVTDVTMSVLFERGTGYGAMAWLGIVGAGFHFGGVLAGAALLAAGVLAATVALAMAGRVRLPRVPLEHRLRTLARDRTELRRLVLMTAFSVVIQALFISSIALIGVAFRVDASWWYWAFAVATVALATLVPVSLGGLGVRESGFATLLAAEGASGAAGASVGFTLALVVALVSLAAVVVMAIAGRLHRLTSAAGRPQDADLPAASSRAAKSSTGSGV